MSNPRVLVTDIETSPIMAKVWGLWNNNVALNQIGNDWHIMSYSAKWLGEEEVIYEDSRDTGEDDYRLLRSLWNLMDEADYIIAHNGRRFDVPKINARFIQQGMLPPSPSRIVDTLDIAKRRFNFTSNKLEYLADVLGCSGKLVDRKFSGMELWNGCMNGIEEAWEEMKAYNIQDTVVLEEVFYKLRPWMTNQMNYNLFTPEEGDSGEVSEVCSKCGGDHLHKRGFSYTNQGKFQRYRCTSCGGWQRGTKAIKRSRQTGISGG